MTSRSPTRRRWRHLGWIILAPLLMGEACPAACGYALLPIAAADKAASKAAEEGLERAWTVSRRFEQRFDLSPARPRAVFDVTLEVGLPAGATYDTAVVLRIATEVPAILRKCREQTCDDYWVCETEKGKSGYPPALNVYPIVDGRGRSKYMDVAFTWDPGREVQAVEHCAIEYPCKYAFRSLPDPCRAPGFNLSFDRTKFTRDPVSGLSTARFRVSLAARDPAGAGYDEILFDTPAAYEKGRAYPSWIRMEAAFEAPMVKRKVPKDQRPPSPGMQLKVTSIE